MTRTHPGNGVNRTNCVRNKVFCKQARREKPCFSSRWPRGASAASVLALLIAVTYAFRAQAVAND